ncbi:hypothetical protein L596_022478 [Steinernema carpocapsae]|uniref:Uncharacterized protein n=1 Tax=Steinernema carpocapsae TaxID=34508 RepID=A0A4U5MLS1_STECR|nr:hypothetical protein L596_022478 [Steinernema carpocapsae]
MGQIREEMRIAEASSFWIATITLLRVAYRPVTAFEIPLLHASPKLFSLAAQLVLDVAEPLQNHQRLASRHSFLKATRNPPHHHSRRTCVLCVWHGVWDVNVWDANVRSPQSLIGRIGLHWSSAEVQPTSTDRIALNATAALLAISCLFDLSLAL